MEKSDEIKGEGNSYTAQFWEYDPRIGRRWNLDPKPTAGISEYSAFNNNPIFYSDPLGNYADPPGWYTKFKAYVQLFSVLTGGDAKKAGEDFDRGMDKLAGARIKSWSEVKSDIKVAAGNAYWSMWGTTNGVVKQLTFGAYSKSPAYFNLNDEQDGYFNTGTLVGQFAPLPTEGGGSFSPRVALSGSGGVVLKSVMSVEVKIATTVFANTANGQQGESTSDNQQSEARDLLNEALGQQGLNSAPNGFKQKWSRGNYDYEVRIHRADRNAPQGSNSALNTVLRVGRRLPGTDAHGQGYGWEYADDNDHWYPHAI